MRTIKKGVSNRNRNLDIAERNNGIPQNAQAASRAWSKFSDKGGTLALKLLQQQFGLCCYTELNLADFHSILGAHFEHEKPKSLYPQQTFDEGNILRCALSSEDLHKYPQGQRFGGHHKGNNFNEDLFISPQSPSCRDFFSYLPSDGKIYPSVTRDEDQTAFDKAEHTIKELNLNAPFLVAERKRRLEEIELEVDRLIDEYGGNGLDAFAEFELCLTRRSHPDHPGQCFDQLHSFHSAVRQIFGRTGETVIANQCPQID